MSHSNHRPLLVDTEYYAGGISRGTQHVKRFEARWLREEKFSDTVQQAWEKVASETPASGIHAKLARMHEEFNDWDQRVLRKPKKRLRKTQKDLESVMCGPMTDENEAKRKELAELVEHLLELEEVQWMQRSRANWLKTAIEILRFFQSFASARRKRNYIKKIEE